MGDYKRIIALALIMAVATTVVLGVIFWLLYNTAFEAQRMRLINMVHSSVHMMKSVADFDQEYSGDYPEGALAATISQIKASHQEFEGFGETGEFVLSHLKEGQIVFLLKHRFHSPDDHHQIIPFDTINAEPTRRALSGLSGTVVGYDYRGEMVLAAYEPVETLNLGVVVKMDIAEIRAPFIKVGVVVITLAFLLVITGSVLFFRLGEPLIQALRQSRKQYRAIVQGHPEMITRFLPDGTITFVNDAFCRFFGKSREELIGQSFAPLVVQDDLEEVKEKVVSLNKDDPVTIIKNRVIAAGGEVRWTRWANQAIWDNEGHVIEYQSGGHDITEQMQAEENLRKSEERFRGIFDESVATIYMFDNEKNFIDANQAGLDLLGYSREELLNMCIPDVDADPVAVLPAHEQLRSGGRLVNYVHRLKCKDGRIISVLNNSRPLTDSKGDVVGMESTLINITERIRTREELRHSEARLSHLLTSSPVVIYTSKASGNYAATYIAPNVKELMGFDPEDFVSDPGFWADNVHPDDSARVFADVEALFELGEFTHDYRFRKPDGTYMWVRDEMNLIYGDDGEPMEIVGSWSDITERKAIGNSLRESEERFRSIYESSTMAMIVAIDHTETVVSWNPGAEKAFGYTNDEIVDKPLTMIMPERYREAHSQGLQRVASGGEHKLIGKSVELYGLHKDGHEFPIELTIGTWQSEGTSFFSAVINDITERKLAEQQMQEKSRSLVLLQRVATASNEAITIEEALQPCLDQVCAYTGWPVGHVYLHDDAAEELFPSMIWHIDNPERFSAFRKITETTICKTGIGLPGRVLASRETEWIADISKDNNFPRAKKKGLGLKTGIAIPIFAGKNVAAVLEFYTEDIIEPEAHMLDILGHVGTQLGRVMERKFAERALRQSEEMTRTMLTSTGQGIYATNLDGECIICNPASVKILGYDDASNLLGQNIHRLVHHTHADGTPYPQDECRLLRVPLENKGVFVDDEVFWRADGSSFPVEYRAYPLHRDADIIGTVVTFDDITARLETDSKLKQAQKMDAIGHMVGGIAHDFNNLLGIVIGNLELLQRLVGDQEKANTRVETALKGARRGASLTQKLLGFSRREPIGAEAQNVNHLILHSHDLLDKLLVKAIELKFDLADDLWLTAVDAGDFENAIMNLCVNARDAMPDGGKIVIETANKHLDADYMMLNPGSKAGDYVQISVSDIGCGMPPEIVEKVFEPFFTTKGRGRGTGLGMSMIYGFVKRSGGYIKIYSEVGHGTTIKVYLPRALDVGESAAEADFPETTAELPRGKETVLVVDDEEDLVDLAVEQLEELGYRTLATINGPEAMKILSSRKKIDLLFSDIIMPGGMNGYDLALGALEKRPRLKVLLTSGYTEKREEEAKYADNPVVSELAANLLNKPYTKIELANRIRWALDREE